MIELIHNIVKLPVLYLRNKLSSRHFFIFSSILVGLTSGLAAILLKYLVHSIERVVTFSSRNYEDFIVFALFPLAGILLTVAYVKYFLHDKLKKGSAEIAYAIVKKSSVLPERDTYGHLISSALTVGFGGSVGLESPMVSTGSAIGSNYGSRYQLSYKERTVLLGCGAAAGIAAAFNAPIAGVLFAIEVLLTDVTAAAFIPLIIAAASGALVSKMILKEGVILSFSLQQPFNYYNVPYYILLGILAGFVSLIFSKTFRATEKMSARIVNPWLKAIAGGLLLFALILLFPPLFGEGYETIKALADLKPGMLTSTSLLATFLESEANVLIFIGALVFLKILAAAVTLGAGGSGGSFAPSLFVGAYLGFVFARIINILNIERIPESNFTLVAMAGILSGVFYAPLTAIFLIAELTGGYELMIPLMIVSSLSLVVTNLFQPLSMEGRKLTEKLKSTVETRDKLLLSRLDLNTLIETNFAVVRPDENLQSLVRLIASSNRNLFPVVDADGKLLGVIHLDKIRNVIFEPEQYTKVSVKDLMTKPAAVVELNENLYEALRKFDLTNQWNLPVVQDEKYLGFLSKSTVLTRYRNELVEIA